MRKLTHGCDLSAVSGGMDVPHPQIVHRNPTMVVTDVEADFLRLRAVSGLAADFDINRMNLYLVAHDATTSPRGQAMQRSIELARAHLAMDTN